jgi:plastocyanin
VVTWTWEYPTQHTVTFASPLVQDSGVRAGGQFEATMPQTPGTYSYSCDIHGFSGSVLVDPN